MDKCENCDVETTASNICESCDEMRCDECMSSKNCTQCNRKLCLECHDEYIRDGYNINTICIDCM